MKKTKAGHRRPKAVDLIEEPGKGGLTLREALFCRYYVGEANFIGTKAMQMAGYPGNDHGAASRATALLKEVRVKARIRELLEHKLAVSDLTSDKVLREIAKIALHQPPTMREFFREDGTMVPVHLWTPEMAAEVKDIVTEELWAGSDENRIWKGYIRKLRLHPHKPHKDKNLEMLAKYFKIISERLELTAKDGDPLFPSDQQTADAQARETRARMLAELGPMVVEGDGGLH